MSITRLAALILGKSIQKEQLFTMEACPKSEVSEFPGHVIEVNGVRVLKVASANGGDVGLAIRLASKKDPGRGKPKPNPPTGVHSFAQCFQAYMSHPIGKWKPIIQKGLSLMLETWLYEPIGFISRTYNAH